MQLSVKGRNLEVTDALRTYAEEKVQRMGRYLEGSAPAMSCSRWKNTGRSPK